jgi:hypothetical protein
MGYVRVGKIPGEKVTLVGVDARDAFLFASEPPLREVEVLCDIDTSQLVGVGILKDPLSFMFCGDEERPGRFDLNMQSWRYRRYVDLDDVRAAGLFGRSGDWVNDGLSRTRSSLSPEPEFELDY